MRYRIHQIKLNLNQGHDDLAAAIRKKLKKKHLAVRDIQIARESIDARKKPDVKLVYTLDFSCDEKLPLDAAKQADYDSQMAKTMQHYRDALKAAWGNDIDKMMQRCQDVWKNDGLKTAGNNGVAKQPMKPTKPMRPVIAGFGPCGMFAALVLAEAGLCPVVLERGQSVDERLLSVKRFWREGILDTESNVQFGEGGAGTFSDGKLTTGIKDIRISKVLRDFVAAGADSNILYQQKPHIGTDQLRNIVKNIRRKIESLGGEIYFNTRLEDLIMEECGGTMRLKALKVQSREVRAYGQDRRPGAGDAAGSTLASGFAEADAIGANERWEGSAGTGDSDANFAGGSADAPSSCSSAVNSVAVNFAGADLVTLGAVSDLADVEIADASSTSIIDADFLILAIGHSARDTFQMLYDRGLPMEQKPFSIGVRIEHPQEMIDRVQYGDAKIAKKLGAADYKLNYRCENGRGVYTFCMCPGGSVINAASEEHTAVTNGMSNSARDGKFANSGLLVDVRTADFASAHPLAGVEFQRKYERLAYEQGGGRPPKTSYRNFRDDQTDRVRNSLPEFAADAIIEAMPHLGRKLKGFDAADAVMTAVETRSSSPVRIRRDETMQSDIRGIYPAGEGAGYAGGIVSAAVDGIKAAERIMAVIFS